MQIQCKTWRWKELKTASAEHCRMVAVDYRKRPWEYRARPAVMFNQILFQLMLAGF